MKRVYNFSAGPSTLPVSVLQKAAKEMLDFNGCGMSVMEMSHRSSMFLDIYNKAEQDLRDLLNIPANYKVLFLQGGGTLQFTMVPLNLFRNSFKADYINSGEWSKKAIKEAQKLGDIKVVASSEEDNFSHLPLIEHSEFRADADYVYYVSNNTIYGTQFKSVIDVKDKVLVCDMSSDILSKPIDVSRYGIIFAGAQKNMGIAGLTVVIIRDDLLGFAPKNISSMLDYKLLVDNESMLNTPPCYSIYIAGLVFQWLKDLGGLSVMQKLNEQKAELLYKAIDQSTLFKTTVSGNDRSLMNVCFKATTPELDKAFITYCETKDLINVKGYRSVGGMRASLYNGMSLEGVQTLVKAIQDFEASQK